VSANLIGSLTDEVESQSRILQDYSRVPMPKAQKGAIFVGAGDSYAAALAGFYACNGRCGALDPYVLGSAPEAARGLEVFFISVSGRTASNVAAAGAVAGLAKRTVAITADGSSPLAMKCDEVLSLPMKYTPRRAGLKSFSLSLLAVMKVVGVTERCDFKSTYASAVKDSGVLSAGRGTTYFLGNSLAHAASLYAAAKTYEVLGSKAHAELLEEFSHMELFALGKSDAVNLFSSFDPSDLSQRLGAALARRGHVVSVVPSGGRSNLERLFHDVFVGQLSVLKRAADRGMVKPKFLSDRGRLEASDSMIYQTPPP